MLKMQYMPQLEEVGILLKMILSLDHPYWCLTLRLITADEFVSCTSYSISRSPNLECVSSHLPETGLRGVPIIPRVIGLGL